MSVGKGFVIILAAVRICLYMRCFSACMGTCRASEKIVTALFTVLWIFEGFLVSISAIGQGSTLMEMSFFWQRFLFVFEMILEKEEKSRQEQERELLEQEVRIYENQFGIIRQSQQNIRALSTI